MKTAIHVCILLLLSAVFSLSRAAGLAPGDSSRADRASDARLETAALAPRTSRV